MLYHFLAIISGAIFVIAVIAGIGPQSLNLISHGIKKNHTYAVALTCFIADSVLILLGCIGLSLDGAHDMILMINLIGALFIIYYTVSKIIALFKSFPKKINLDGGQNLLTKKEAIFRAMALTFLNPLVFIDTLIVIGGTSYHYHGLEWLDFVIGAILGDFIWCYGLAYISHRFSHRLNQPRIWLALDIITILIMLVILYKTIGFIFK